MDGPSPITFKTSKAIVLNKAGNQSSFGARLNRLKTATVEKPNLWFFRVLTLWQLRIFGLETSKILRLREPQGSWLTIMLALPSVVGLVMMLSWICVLSDGRFCCDIVVCVVIQYLMRASLSLCVAMWMGVYLDLGYAGARRLFRDVTLDW